MATDPGEGKAVRLRGDDPDEPYASDVSFEVALDEDPEPGPPVLVDAPGAAAPVPVRAPLPPVIPAHLRSVSGIRKTAGGHARLAAYRVTVHSLRSPRYLFLALAYAVLGLFRALGRVIAWAWVAEMEHTRSDLAAKGDHKAYLSVHAEQKDTRRGRGIALLAIAVAVLVAVAVCRARHLWWPWAVLGVASVPFLAHLGRPADRRIISPVAVTPRMRRLSADVVLRAYYAAGLGHPSKPDMQVTFGSAMARDGEGSRVTVDLPYGLGLGDAMAARDKIASGLDVTASQVYISRDPTSHRRHVLWVADRDPLAVPVGRTPLLACRQTDIWKPAPLGLDERGQLVTLPLMWNSVLVGALPRQGKTFTARLLGLYAALDPWAQIDVFDGKGSPDWRHFALVAESFAFGLTPTRDGLPPEILLATLERLKADVQWRYQRLSELPTSVCPQGKLTRAIARDPRYGMPVRVLILEELQEYYDLGEISMEIASLIRFMVKVAPGAGVSVIGSTQRPSGVGSSQKLASMFIGARDNFQIRFGLRTSSWKMSDLVLGDGAYSEGLDTSALLPGYKGVGILRGASDANPTVRTYLADGADAERILKAAHKLREQAGTLSGMAAGEDISQPPRDVLADVLSVFAGETGLHWAMVAERLARRYPDRWADATAEALSAQCRNLDVPSVDVKIAGVGLKGCRRTDVEAARL